MLTDKEINFIKDELTKKGVIFESVQQMVETNPENIRKLCMDIMSEEWENEEKEEENEELDIYDPVRLGIAEDIYYRKLYEKASN